MTLSATEKAVFRHYYRKLKKQTRGGKMHPDIGGYLPGDQMAKYNRMGLLWRGTDRGELETIADKGKFVSAWTSGAFPKKPRTYVAGGPEFAKNYALTAAAFTGDRGGLQAARFGHHTGKNLADTNKNARIYAIAPSALKRSDNKIRGYIGSYADTAPLRGGIFRSEVRGILKPTQSGKTVRWRPASLGDVQNRNFSARLRLRELAVRSGMASLAPFAGL